MCCGPIRYKGEIYETVEEFTYVTYSYIRSHRFNGYRTPDQARGAAYMDLRKTQYFSNKCSKNV